MSTALDEVKQRMDQRSRQRARYGRAWMQMGQRPEIESHELTTDAFTETELLAFFAAAEGRGLQPLFEKRVVKTPRGGRTSVARLFVNCTAEDWEAITK